MGTGEELELDTVEVGEVVEDDEMVVEVADVVSSVVDVVDVVVGVEEVVVTEETGPIGNGMEIVGRMARFCL